MEHTQTHSMRPPSPSYQNQMIIPHIKRNFRPVSLTTDKDKTLMEASWWERLGLDLMGGAMLSKSLIQFSVDGRGCIPSLFDLRPNYGGGNDDFILKSSRQRRWWTCAPKDHLAWVRIQVPFILEGRDYSIFGSLSAPRGNVWTSSTCSYSELGLTRRFLLLFSVEHFKNTIYQLRSVHSKRTI